MSEQAIVLNELTKHYGKHRGINNLSFSVYYLMKNKE